MVEHPAKHLAEYFKFSHKSRASFASSPFLIGAKARVGASGALIPKLTANDQKDRLKIWFVLTNMSEA